MARLFLAAIEAPGVSAASFPRPSNNRRNRYDLGEWH
jgi:hypothetical protein